MIPREIPQEVIAQGHDAIVLWLTRQTAADFVYEQTYNRTLLEMERQRPRGLLGRLFRKS